MDTRKLSTADVLVGGILSRPVPKTDVPVDRPRMSYDAYDNSPPREELLTALERGDVLSCSEYYGIPNVWRDGETYRGCLLQYRAVTESPEFQAAEDALDWFVQRAHALAG